MLSRRFFVSTLSAVLVLVLSTFRPATAQTDPAGAAQFIQWMADQAIGTLKNPSVTLEQREAAFRNIMRTAFDIEFIGRFVLGRAWQTASTEEKSDYIQLFGEYLVKTYSRRLSAYNGETFSVLNSQPAGEQDAVVRTRIDRPSAAPINADWRVRIIQGQYKVVDIVVEGVSMGLTQRSDFTAVVQSGGMPALIGQLRARTERLSAQR